VAKAIDPNDPRSPYQQIADDLRDALEAGEFTPGHRMPSTRELAGEYGVAAMTVHQAIRILRDEGLVVAYQGRGIFVRSDEHQDTARPSTSSQLNAIGDDLSRLDARVSDLGQDLRLEVAELRQQVGEFRAQLIELYARTGHQYPRDNATEPAGAPKRRRAAGA
jgi:DNA-binding transcriptional regulator YhcF (GntR family)